MKSSGQKVIKKYSLNSLTSGRNLTKIFKMWKYGPNKALFRIIIDSVNFYANFCGI